MNRINRFALGLVLATQVPALAMEKTPAMLQLGEDTRLKNTKTMIDLARAQLDSLEKALPMLKDKPAILGKLCDALFDFDRDINEQLLLLESEEEQLRTH